MPSDEPKLPNNDDGDNDEKARIVEVATRFISIVNVISTKSLRCQSEDVKCFPLFNEKKHLAYEMRSHQLMYQSSTNPS
jgi:hypothetical protein